MHVHASTLLKALAIPIVTASLAYGQSTVQNTVTVTIPTVLRLQVGGSTAIDTRSVDFSITGTAVTPDQLAVEVFANSSWTLTVTDNGGDGPQLQYTLLGETVDWKTPGERPVVDKGGPTGGWKTLELGFRVDDPAAASLIDGTHTRTLLFTLTRP